jgi:hypothetical protein
VKEEMSTIWPLTDATEVTDREVTDLFKIRYLPLNIAYLTKLTTRKRAGKLDLKTETSHRWALVVIPLGGDGGIGHAITIVLEDLIFNSVML